MSPSSGPASDLAARHTGVRAPESYQRSPHNTSGGVRVAGADQLVRVGDLMQGGVFKAPMPPQQELFVNSGVGGGSREPVRPTELGHTLPQAQPSGFPPSPLSGLGSPHRSPYAQAPGTPRPDYSQQVMDPFNQHSPLNSRPSPDPYSNPQTPGTPRSHCDPSYLTTPSALRLDQYNQQPTNPRPSPSHPMIDPHNSNPGTPRPSVSERFPRSPGSQRSSDPYIQPVGTPRPSPDPYAQQPSTPRPHKAPESFIQNQADGFNPSTLGPRSSPMAQVEPAAFNATAQVQEVITSQHCCYTNVFLFSILMFIW